MVMGKASRRRQEGKRNKDTVFDDKTEELITVVKTGVDCIRETASAMKRVVESCPEEVPLQPLNDADAEAWKIPESLKGIFKTRMTSETNPIGFDGSLPLTLETLEKRLKEDSPLYLDCAALCAIFHACLSFPEDVHRGFSIHIVGGFSSWQNDAEYLAPSENLYELISYPGVVCNARGQWIMRIPGTDDTYVGMAKIPMKGSLKSWITTSTKDFHEWVHEKTPAEQAGTLTSATRDLVETHVHMGESLVLLPRPFVQPAYVHALKELDKVRGERIASQLRILLLKESEELQTICEKMDRDSVSSPVSSK